MSNFDSLQIDCRIEVLSVGFRSFDLPKTKILLYESKHLPGDSVTLHHHTIYQILYILSGDGIVRLDGEVYDVGPDQMVLIAPFSEHAVSTQSRMTLLVLAFENFLTALDGAELMLDRVFKQSKYHMVHTMAANELRDSFRKILYEQGARDSFADVAIRNRLLQILLTLARSFDEKHFSDSNDYRANVVRRYIEENYFKRISAQDMASQLRITPRHVNAIFSEQFHTTPMQYLTDVRVKHAKQLLTESDKDIVSICFEVGFETISTFYRVFKKHVGLSPQTFRKTSAGVDTATAHAAE